MCVSGPGEGTQGQRGALGRDPQERELKALNFTYPMSPVRILGISQGWTQAGAGCGCPARLTLCPEDTVLPRALKVPRGCVWTFSIHSTPAWLENLTLQAGECAGEAETHCRL